MSMMMMMMMMMMMKANLVHFSLTIRHLVATILMIFVRVN